MHENTENIQNAENAENAGSKTQENSERGNKRTSPVLQTESQEEKVERLAQTVEGLLEMFQGIMPLVTKLATKESEIEAKMGTPESVERKPWERRRPSPTFTEFAGSLAYDSPEMFPRDRVKRRETIFDESDKLERSAKQPTFRKNVPPFSKKLYSLEFSDINKNFKELYAYQSEHDCHEKGCPHLAWSVRSMLCPVGMSEQQFLQISNAELFAFIRAEIRPNSQSDFQEKFIQNLSFHIKDNFILGQIPIGNGAPL
jgi:hypothetical protein